MGFAASLPRKDRPRPALCTRRPGRRGRTVAPELSTRKAPWYPILASLPFDSLSPGRLALLILALGIALGFEFVNGFHDTANAVATVIYTKALTPRKGRDLVGPVQLRRRPARRDGRGVQHRPPAAGRASGLGRLRVGDGDDPLAPDRRDPLEPGHLVAGAAGLQLSHAHRRDPRRRPGQFDPAGTRVRPPGWTGPWPARSACRCSSRPWSDSPVPRPFIY